MAIIPRTGHTVTDVWTQRKRIYSDENRSNDGPTATSLASRWGSTARTLSPLEHGDRLTRSDFEQRYDAMPHVQKADLIEGSAGHQAFAEALTAAMRTKP